MADCNAFNALLAYYSKRCPACGSNRASSTNTDPPVHTCMGCGYIFRDDEALPSMATVNKAKGIDGP